MATDRLELASWLRLTLIPGVGGESRRALLKAFGLPQAIFEASQRALSAVVDPALAERLLGHECAVDIDAALDWAAQPGNRLLTLADVDYPQSLLTADDPPVLLYAKGDAAMLNRPMLAVVGSRNATPQGLQTAEAFARALAAKGLGIISGLALGIDAAAHRGALAAKGATIAVIGTGADRVYPARNKELAMAIAEHGTIVSEFPLGTPAIAANFPRRNRIISGLARGVLVVEAALESGSLITARLAADQGREVFAIPGSIHSPVARGCHKLIKQGAKLVETAQDILEELGSHPESPGIPEVVATTANSVILKALGYDPCALDDLVDRTGISAEQLLGELLTLELDGLIATLPGNRYQRLA